MGSSVRVFILSISDSAWDPYLDPHKSFLDSPLPYFENNFKEIFHLPEDLPICSEENREFKLVWQQRACATPVKEVSDGIRVFRRYLSRLSKGKS
jgi:hypothetical protein